MKHEKLIDSDNPILRKRSKDVAIGSDVSSLLKDMREVLDAVSTGVGLAAPQIGSTSSVFISRVHGNEIVYINPKIIKKYGPLKTSLEGCLSLPGIIKTVKRSEKVYLEFFDENWIKHKEVHGGFISFVIQHEYDHLKGKLITDYVD